MADYNLLFQGQPQGRPGGFDPLGGQMRLQQVQQNELALQQQQQEQARSQQFNELLGQYIGQGTVNTLGNGGQQPQYMNADGSPQQGPPPVDINQLYAIDPNRAQALQAFQQRQQQAQQAQEQQQAKSAYTNAQYVLSSKDPGHLVKTAFPDAWQKIIDLGEDPETFTPEKWRQEAQDMLAHYGSILGAGPAGPEGQEAFTLSQGQTRFGPNGQPIASVAAAESDKDPTDKTFNRANVLRDEYNTLNKDFNVIDSSFGNIIATARVPSAAGDISLITSYMKMLDPNSTVREGEFANAQNAGGVPDKVRATVNSLLNGERLSDEQRKDFVSQARNIRSERAKQRDKNFDRYKGLAERAGVAAKDVVGDESAIANGNVAAMTDDDLLKALTGGR